MSRAMGDAARGMPTTGCILSMVGEVNLFFYKKSSIKLPKKQKNKYKYACGLMTETDTHTHASNDSYEHPPHVNI